jgi:hypothetical protein
MITCGSDGNEEVAAAYEDSLAFITSKRAAGPLTHVDIYTLKRAV